MINQGHSDDIGLIGQSNRSMVVGSSTHDQNIDQNQSQISDGTMSLGAGLNKMNEMLYSGVTGKIKNNDYLDTVQNINKDHEDVNMALFNIDHMENNNNVDINDGNFNCVDNNDINFGLDTSNEANELSKQ